MKRPLNSLSITNAGNTHENPASNGQVKIKFMEQQLHPSLLAECRVAGKRCNLLQLPTELKDLQTGSNRSILECNLNISEWSLHCSRGSKTHRLIDRATLHDRVQYHCLSKTSASTRLLGLRPNALQDGFHGQLRHAQTSFRSHMAEHAAWEFSAKLASVIDQLFALEFGVGQRADWQPHQADSCE